MHKIIKDKERTYGVFLARQFAPYAAVDDVINDRVWNNNVKAMGPWLSEDFPLTEKVSTYADLIKSLDMFEAENDKRYEEENKKNGNANKKK